jgi:ParB/RepB/Spo0J family partition protein
MKQIKEIPIEKLIVDECNIRTETWDQCPNFVEDVKDNGVQNPLLVRPLKDGKYGVVAGSRRFNASIDGQRKTVPCIIEEMDDLTALGQSFRENAMRKEVSVSMYVSAIGKMYDILKASMPTVGMEKIVSEVCSKTGLARSSAQNYIKLSQELSEESKELLNEPEQRTKEFNNKVQKFKPSSHVPKLKVKEALELTKVPKAKQLESVVKHKPTCSTSTCRVPTEDDIPESKLPEITSPTKEGIAKSKNEQLQVWIGLGKNLGVSNVEMDRTKEGVKKFKKWIKTYVPDLKVGKTYGFFFYEVPEPQKLEAQLALDAEYVTEKVGKTTIATRKKH